MLDGDGGHTELVTITTIAKVCEAHQIARIDVLKMDVQGWELEVLRGAERMLVEDRIDFGFSEVAFRRADGDMQHFAALNDFLEARGFWLCGFYDHYRWGPNRRYLGFSSALYTKRRDTSGGPTTFAARTITDVAEASSTDAPGRNPAQRVPRAGWRHAG